MNDFASPALRGAVRAVIPLRLRNLAHGVLRWEALVVAGGYRGETMATLLVAWLLYRVAQPHVVARLG